MSLSGFSRQQQLQKKIIEYLITAQKMTIIFLGKNRHTVELQWLEHLWIHENMFETGVVRANECQSQHQVRWHNSFLFS